MGYLGELVTRWLVVLDNPVEGVKQRAVWGGNTAVCGEGGHGFQSFGPFQFTV